MLKLKVRLLSLKVTLLECHKDCVDHSNDTFVGPLYKSIAKQYMNIINSLQEIMDEVEELDRKT